MHWGRRDGVPTNDEFGPFAPLRCLCHLADNSNIHDR